MTIELTDVQKEIFFLIHFIAISNIFRKFADADRLAEAPVWGNERRDAET